MRKNILRLNNVEVEAYFVKPESYINFDMPKYFNFSDILDEVASNVSILNSQDIFKAKGVENVNHVIYSNKDGKYSWRKFEILNPILYVSLVKLITNKQAWTAIVKEVRAPNNKIFCYSIPMAGTLHSKTRRLQIEEWLEEVEKESLKLALDYEYMYQTDVTDCYGSIYTHSIPWAIHGKTISKQKRGYNDLFGNAIDHHLQAMSYGQTNGIPQGSVLMDFLAEIVLNFADLELAKLLSKVKNYKIIRFRDDYRIFVRNPIDG